MPIDDVRYITNFSSGRYGSELLEYFTDKENIDIIFFHEKGTNHTQYGPIDVDIYKNSKIRFIEYKDYWDYLKVKDIIKKEQPDIIISAAAINDYVVDKIQGKLSSDQDELIIKLKKGEKVIQSFRELAPDALIVGFKLLVSPTQDEKAKAIYNQLKYVDTVIYNDLTELRKGDQLREFVHWVEGDKVYSKKMSASEIVDGILLANFFKKVFK